MGSPFTPFQHLLCCLPPKSANCLPPSYAFLVSSPSSPLAPYYPSAFCQDLNGKTKSYEAVILLPFIQEEVILDAVQTTHADIPLTEDEHLRNAFESEYVFYYSSSSSSLTEKPVSVYPTPLSPEFFPSIEDCHAHREIIPTNDYTVIFHHLAERAIPTDRTARFASLTPYCSGIRHEIEVEKTKQSTRPTQSTRPQRYKVETTIRTIVEIDSGALPYIATEESMRQLGERYVNQCVEYDFPHHKIGLVVGVVSYQYHYTLDKQGKPIVRKHSEVQTAHMKEKLERMKKIAMDGFPQDAHDIGHIDISENTLLLQLLPIYRIQRMQESGKAFPYFVSHQPIDYPFLLTRRIPPNELNFMGGGYSLRSPLYQENIQKGEEVVYIGKAKAGTTSLCGMRGVVTDINQSILSLSLMVPTTDHVAQYIEQPWYSFQALRAQIPKDYHSIFSVCMRTVNVTDPMTKKTVSIGLDLAPGRRGIEREGYVRIQSVNPSSSSKHPYYHLSCFSMLATNATEEEGDPFKQNAMGFPEGVQEEYSQKACELVCAYFKRFGPILQKGITVNGRERVFHSDVLQVGWMNEWMDE